MDLKPWFIFFTPIAAHHFGFPLYFPLQMILLYENGIDETTRKDSGQNSLNHPKPSLQIAFPS